MRVYAGIPKILIVDADSSSRNLLRFYLRENDFIVEVADSAIELSRIWLRERFDVLVLGLELPGENGLQVLKRLRANDNTPILILTDNNYDIDGIIGLELGADDCMVKPINPRELLARIRSILRRRNFVDGQIDFLHEEKVITFGNFIFDVDRQNLRKNGDLISLPAEDSFVLKIFICSPRVLITRNKYVEIKKRQERTVSSRSLDVRVGRLRKVIELNPCRPRYLQTIWREGYVFIPD